MAFLMAASLTADVATDFAGALSLARRYLASARQAQQAAAEAGLAAAGGDKIDVYLLLTVSAWGALPQGSRVGAGAGVGALCLSLCRGRSAVAAGRGTSQ